MVTPSKLRLSPLPLLVAAAMAAAGCQAAASTEQLQGQVAEPTAVADAAAAEPSLQQVDGTLRHLFSVSFTADRAILATVTGLVTQGVARTSSGGELEVTFPPGVPYPQGVGSVIVRDVPDPKNRPAIDHLAPPPEMSPRQGLSLVTSHRVGGRLTQYLVVWRDQRTGEHTVTLFDASKPGAAEPVVARSRAPILGVAESPQIRPMGYYVTVWTMAGQESNSGDERKVVVESYLWQPATS